MMLHRAGKDMKKGMIPLLATFAVMGGGGHALAGPMEGDTSAMIGLSYVYPKDTSFKWHDSTSQTQKIKVKRDSSSYTGSLGLRVMATDDIGLDFGTSWSSKVKQKLIHGTDTYKLQYKIMPWHIAGQYFLMMPSDMVRPYVGFGLHFTEISKSKVTNNANKISKIDIDNEYGLVAQLGALFSIDEEAFINVSASYFNLEPDGKITSIKSDNGKAKAKTKKIDLSPWLFNISVGFKI